MSLTSAIAKLERGAMRKFPPAAVLLLNGFVHARFGEPELFELKRLVRPGTVAVDVGAHFGVYSLALARRVGKRGRIISVEPITEDARMLERAARTLRLPISVVEAALSNTEGEATLRVPLLGGAQKTALSTLEREAQAAGATGVEERTVPLRTLDRVLEDIDLPVSFIKIDVEGHELSVLEGAKATLAQHRPNLMVEINDDLAGRPINEVFARIESMGYRGEFLEKGQYWRPLAAFDVEEHQRNASGNVLSKAYVNNFVFLPEG